MITGWRTNAKVGRSLSALTMKRATAMTVGAANWDKEIATAIAMAIGRQDRPNQKQVERRSISVSLLVCFAVARLKQTETDTGAHRVDDSVRQLRASVTNPTWLRSK